MKSRFKIPHTLVLLFGMMVLALLGTYLLPQGRFETVPSAHGKTMVVQGTYARVATPNYLPAWHVLTVVPRAFADAQDIIFFVFIIGGALGVIKSTGAIDAMIGKLIQKFGTRRWLLVLGGLLAFGVGSSTLGMAEEYLPFVAVLLLLGRAIGLDPVAAVGIMIVGYGVGYGAAALNPFTVMIAQEIAGLAPTSGLWYRLVLFPVFFLFGFWHLLRHIKKGAASVEPSPPLALQSGAAAPSPACPPLSSRHIGILLLLAAAIVLIVYGISAWSGWNWYLIELGAVFLGLTILVALVGCVSPDQTALAFAQGATELTTTALLIGFARSIALILEDGQVIHTVVYALALPLQQAGPELASVGMFAVQSVLNFFVPSGSGQAFVTMPIMAPTADLVGVTRQVAVLAYQFGDGFTNMLVPTNAVLMGILGLGGISYDRWFRFIWPLMLQFLVLGSLALVVAVWMGYR